MLTNLMADMKVAMKNKDKNKLLALRNMISTIKAKQIDIGKSLSDDESSIILQKIAKKLEPYKRTCGEIGYSEGTDKFGDCVMELIAMDKKSGESQAMDDANRIERAKILLGLSQMIGQRSSGSSSSWRSPCAAAPGWRFDR